MKKLLTIVSILLLTACTDARGYALQDQFCSDKGGVFEYATGTSEMSYGFCRDNTQFKWTEVKRFKLRPEFYPDKEE